MNELGNLKRVYHADEKTQTQREYRPATPFVISSPIKETSPEVWKEYILFIAGTVMLFVAAGVAVLFM